MDNDIEMTEPILRRECVQWPKTEPIPRTIEEALALGWEITDEHATVSADELTMEGTANLSKTIDLLELYLTIPFTAIKTYGQPFDPKAEVEISNISGTNHKCQTLIAQ